jgi:hypothetical protein
MTNNFLFKAAQYTIHMMTYRTYKIYTSYTSTTLPMFDMFETVTLNFTILILTCFCMESSVNINKKEIIFVVENKTILYTCTYAFCNSQ